MKLTWKNSLFIYLKKKVGKDPDLILAIDLFRTAVDAVALRRILVRGMLKFGCGFCYLILGMANSVVEVEGGMSSIDSYLSCLY